MRLLKFSLVGLVGILVQLAVLAVLAGKGEHYLLATLCAVEAAVLNNFLWHQNFTWKDRHDSHILSRLLRFHASNATISLLGNLLLMRLLVGECNMNLLPANALAISTCALVNFLVSDRWVFTSSALSERTRQFTGSSSLYRA